MKNLSKRQRVLRGLTIAWYILAFVFWIMLMFSPEWPTSDSRHLIVFNIYTLLTCLLSLFLKKYDSERKVPVAVKAVVAVMFLLLVVRLVLGRGQ